MSTPMNPRANHTTYPINPEEAAETGRLLLQDRSLTKVMGGVFPAGFTPTPGQIILDLACGPGGWALDIARSYPSVDVVGVDISRKMIRYAQAQAEVLGLQNVSFHLMDVLKPLEFPDDAFEFVNARYIAPFMPRDKWAGFLQECLRVAIPGGFIRLTEFAEGCVSSAAYVRIGEMAMRAMWLDGKFFSFDGIKIIPAALMLGKLLKDAGLTGIQKQAHYLEYSYGTEEYDTWYHNMLMVFGLFCPFLLKMGMVTKKEFDRLYNQVEMEMQEPEFLAHLFLLSAWGTKPERS